MKLQGKTVFVTGSNRGIGKTLIETMAAEGANIYAHARTKSEVFEKDLSDMAQKYKVSVQPVYFELTDKEAMQKEMKPILQSGTSLDVLINNAGVAHGGFFSMTKVQTIRDVFEINLFAAMELTQLVLRKMIRQKKGCIINMSSIAAYDIKPGNSAYGVSKAAVKAWTETLAAEVARNGIRVNAIAPGLTDTEMAKQMEKKAGEEMVQASAMGRLATTEEIANVAVFLASDDASFVNGHTVVVNGGFD